MTLMIMAPSPSHPPYPPPSSKKSQFSDTSLSTLESLLLECALEDARHKAAAKSTTRNSPYYLCQQQLRLNIPDSEQQYEMHTGDHEALKQLPGNDHCADCGSTDTEWASVTFGILICTRCSGHHRSLGTHISRVRSIKMDSWTPAHLERMKAGGNGRWKEYLTQLQQDQQGVLSSSVSFKDKYDSATARLYSQQLLSLPVLAEETKSDILASTSTTNQDSTNGGLRPTSPMRSLTGKDDNENKNQTTTATQTKQQSQQPIAASSPTITYMGRSFPASSITLKCSNHNSNRSRISSPAKAATTADAISTTAIKRAPFFAKKQSKKKTTSATMGHKARDRQSKRRHTKPNRLHPKQHDKPKKLTVTDRYPAAAVLLYSQQDVLDITGDKWEFARLQRTLKHNGAITNEVVKQRMFAFVLKRKQKKQQEQVNNMANDNEDKGIAAIQQQQQPGNE